MEEWGGVWEHKVVSVELQFGAAQRALAQVDNEDPAGWQLAAAVPNGDTLLMFFRRPTQ